MSYLYFRKRCLKVRPDDRLSNLDPAARLRLDAWLKTHTYRETVRLAALPQPEGLNLKTNTRALSVYYRKYLAPNPLDRLVQMSAVYPAAAQTAATALLQAQALAAASSPDLDIHTFNTLVRYHANTIRAEQEAQRASLRKMNIAFRTARAEAPNP